MPCTEPWSAMLLALLQGTRSERGPIGRVNCSTPLDPMAEPGGRVWTTTTFDYFTRSAAARRLSPERTAARLPRCQRPLRPLVAHM